MCEKRIKKIKKGSHINRMREARRVQRLHWMSSPIPAEEAPSTPSPPPAHAPGPASQATVDKTAQNRVILELAWKTIALMQKNRLIQQKIIALQKETSEFVAAIMSNPVNRRRYLEHIRLHGAGLVRSHQLSRNVPFKIEPKH